MTTIFRPLLLGLTIVYVSGCSSPSEENGDLLREYIFDVLFIVLALLLLIFALVAATRPFRKRNKTTKANEDSTNIGDTSKPKKSEETTTSSTEKESRVFLTSAFDDFYPLPRKFHINAEPQGEDKYHRKFNYHYIIEKLTRKLYFLMIAITFLTISFAYVLYKTSISERITPDYRVMEEYGEMMGDIFAVEDSLEKAQIARVDELSGISDSAQQSVKINILNQTVEYEDKLVSEVNSSFFRIYYWRYALVRFLVAFVIIAFIRYLMVLYMRIRADRNDLIRKEEALSILFYVLEEMNLGKDSSIGQVLADKIPNFPLRTLFSSPDSGGKGKKNGISPELESLLEDMVDTQNRSVQSIERLLEIIAKKIK